MKKLIMAAAALTIAVATAPGFVGPSQAASAKKSPFCDMAKNQRNMPSWNEHYGCLKPAQRQVMASANAPTEARPATPGGTSPFCKMANGQRNTPSWNEYYHCLR